MIVWYYVSKQNVIYHKHGNKLLAVFDLLIIASWKGLINIAQINSMEKITNSYKVRKSHPWGGGGYFGQKQGENWPLLLSNCVCKVKEVRHCIYMYLKKWFHNGECNLRLYPLTIISVSQYAIETIPYTIFWILIYWFYVLKLKFTIHSDQHSDNFCFMYIWKSQHCPAHLQVQEILHLNFQESRKILTVWHGSSLL